MIPGPWAGAACPNRNKGCQGTLKPYHTLYSEAQGNSYFYRDDTCGAQVVLDFKLSSIKQ